MRLTDTINMSPDGLLFTVHHFVMKGKLLHLVFPFRISPRINAKGEMRWTGRVVDIKYYLGVRFSQMQD